MLHRRIDQSRVNLLCENVDWINTVNEMIDEFMQCRR